MIWPKLTTAMSLPSSFLCSYPAPVVNAIRLTNLVILDFIQNRSKALPVKRNIYVPLHTLALVVDWLLCLVHSCLWISLKSALSAYVLWHNAYLSSFVCMQSAPQPTLHSLLALWRTMCSSRRWCPYDAHWSPLVCPGLGNSCSAHSHSSNSKTRPGGKVVLNRDPHSQTTHFPKYIVTFHWKDIVCIYNKIHIGPFWRNVHQYVWWGSFVHINGVCSKNL